jgi:hypothetical protein
MNNNIEQVTRDLVKKLDGQRFEGYVSVREVGGHVQAGKDHCRMLFALQDTRHSQVELFDLMVGTPESFKAEEVGTVIASSNFIMGFCTLHHCLSRITNPETPFPLGDVHVTRMVRSGDYGIYYWWLEIEVPLQDSELKARLIFPMKDSLMSWAFQRRRIAQFLSFFKDGLSRHNMLDQVPVEIWENLSADLSAFVLGDRWIFATSMPYVMDSTNRDSAVVVNRSTDHLVFRFFGKSQPGRLGDDLWAKFILHYEPELFEIK